MSALLETCLTKQQRAEADAADAAQRQQPAPSRADTAIAALQARHTVHGRTGHAALCESYEALIRKLFAELDGPAQELIPGVKAALDGLGVRS